jgi:hypothetical protein
MRLTKAIPLMSVSAEFPMIAFTLPTGLHTPPPREISGQHEPLKKLALNRFAEIRIPDLVFEALSCKKNRFGLINEDDL